jgi:hypothetical protein
MPCEHHHVRFFAVKVMFSNKNGAVDLAPSIAEGLSRLLRSLLLMSFIRLVSGLRMWCRLRVKLLLRHLRAGLLLMHFLRVELLLLRVELLL